MDASQYKDYVLVLLFVKYVSDKYAGDPDGLIEIPEGGSFSDMVALKGDKEIGEKINIIIAKLAERLRFNAESRIQLMGYAVEVHLIKKQQRLGGWSHRRHHDLGLATAPVERQLLEMLPSSELGGLPSA